ncbi:tRNA (adenosine(37)-N6)-threonylcarbamoyltransferase complex dimerization subunit type 1 TsaB [Methyloligella sp. 2.7D]|uniref:tRNA (adenosine(37)-N6)-threonylcarbamoyltransferase complex dimerization subunit type 1 TsaB n=1 Tax=unclassified Methyloligella TaxID=2625955 RepID=UPI00157D8209|nr:tRNA (adenosine(37)-N6)-threonylcarbamoyltransferase complex dimerization subunit type 1 TsaB [Methyloligella sp. GL2]QKP76140.1 tRNA (adenosine(37)-N6)-threonylcarbamoyltransferase complex dimerization subunit type 1 TsaB [Methyloligella sp. GL2]
MQHDATVLALDTAMGNCSAAVLRGGNAPRVLASRAEAMARGHAEALMPMIEQAMDEAGLAFADLDRIAATTGPGSFTGVRIAIAAARGLALATGAELWGTDALSVMAKRAAKEALNGDADFAIAVDAKRERLYFGVFDAEAARQSGPQIVSPADALGLLPASVTRVLGSGAEMLRAEAGKEGRQLDALAPDLQPDAVSLGLLALQGGDAMPNLRPLYLRPPDAKPQTGKSVARK